jgi:glycosyltransferase involved in cell wall biosynthesis
MKTHTIVVCTRNRVKTIKEFLSHLVKLKNIERVKILIVENSDDECSLAEIASFIEISLIKNVEIIRSSPGLARARNVALQKVTTDLVHFLDDDLELPVEFIKLMDEADALFPLAAGFAPYIVKRSLEDKLGDPLRVSRFFKLLQKNECKLSKSGRARWLVTPGKIMPADWLPGCCMTYRTSAIKGMKFDENLELGPLGGYALGEDLVFSHQLSKTNNIFALGNIIVFHNLEPNERTNWSKMDDGIGRLRAYLYKKFPSDVALTNTFVSLILEGLNDLLRVKVLKQKQVDYPHSLFRRLAAFKNELKHPSISGNL